MNCPPLNALLDYSRGLSVSAESAGIEGHLQTGCRDCDGDVRWLSDMAQFTARDRSFDFPEEVIKGLVVWFKAQPVPVTRVWRKLVAQLRFDSLLSLQSAPVRGEFELPAAPQPAGRQLLFQAEGYDVDLRFETVENHVVEDLIGQIFPQDIAQPIPHGLTVQLWQGEQKQLSVQTDQQGLFRFAGISSGVYDLKIHVDEGEISLNQVPTARHVVAAG